MEFCEDERIMLEYLSWEKKEKQQNILIKQIITRRKLKKKKNKMKIQGRLMQQNR